MTEQEEFEFRLRAEQEAARASGMTHSFTGDFRPPRKPWSWGDVGIGLKQGLGDVGTGITQALIEKFDTPEKITWARNYVQAQRDEANKKALVEGSPSISKDLGQMLGFAAPATAAGVLAGPSIPAATVIGGLQGYLSPHVSDLEKYANTGIGAASAFGTSLALRGAMPRNISEPEHRLAINAGRREGMKFTGGQISDEPIVKLSEARSKWNPLTRWSAIPFERKQDDQFIAGVLKQTGIPESMIPENPSLSPTILSKVQDEFTKRYSKVFPETGSFDMTNSAQPGVWNALRKLNPNNLNLVPDEKQAVADAARQVRSVLYTNNGKVPAPLYQDTLDLVSREAERLSKAGFDRGAKALRGLYDDMVSALPNVDEFNALQGDYARFIAIQDTLAHSKGMVEGIPDRGRLAKVVENSMPGGITRDKSTMADIARGGTKSVGPGALPDRASGWPKLSDIPNAATYWRFNNPLGKWGLLNPNARDMAEMLTRYLPASRAEAEVNK